MMVDRRLVQWFAISVDLAWRLGVSDFSPGGCLMTRVGGYRLLVAIATIVSLNQIIFAFSAFTSTDLSLN